MVPMPTVSHFIEGDRVARRWPALGDRPGSAVPSKARGAPASRHASTSKHGPAARKTDSKSAFPANALLTSPSRRVVAIEATRSGPISHRGHFGAGQILPLVCRLLCFWSCCRADCAASIDTSTEFSSSSGSGSERGRSSVLRLASGNGERLRRWRAEALPAPLHHRGVSIDSVEFCKVDLVSSHIMICHIDALLAVVREL